MPPVMQTPMYVKIEVSRNCGSILALELTSRQHLRGRLHALHPVGRPAVWDYEVHGSSRSLARPKSDEICMCLHSNA